MQNYDTPVYNFALMGIIYSVVYIGPVLRHHVDYTRVTLATCVLKGQI